MSLRDDLLPVVDQLRQLPDDFGLRRYSVTLRRRVWSGGAPGLGTATVTDVVLSPRPRVRQLNSKEVAASGGTYEEGDYRIDRVTPSYTGGGYAPDELYLRAVNADEDVAVILVGDAGFEEECEVRSSTFDRAFGFSIVAGKIRGPSRG